MNIIDAAIKRGAGNLTEYEAKQFFAEHGVPITLEKPVQTEEDAVAAAREIGYPVVLKGSGPEIIHKTEMNLVSLDIRDDNEVREAFRRLTSPPEARINEILVQQMVKGDRELMVGLIRDSQFGPCVMFGIGGIFTEILKDVTFRIAPLTREDALEMLEDIRGGKILESFRGKPAADTEKLADILVAIGQIGMRYERIREIDINPLKLHNGTPVALDALIVLNSEPERETHTYHVSGFGEGIPPKSVGIVGISRKQRDDFSGNAPGYNGYMLFRMLRDSGFQGRIYPINPKAIDIEGIKAYPNVTSVPEPLDLVIITVQAPVVPQVLEDCVNAKALNVHICSSGFAETGETEGKRLEDRLREIALRGKLRVIGPNCMGLHIPSVNLKMFQKVDLKQGPVAFISQSGGNAEVFLFLGPLLGFGFSKVISYGNALTLEATEFVEYFARDPETRIICMYVEGIRDGRRFLETVRKVNPIKPIIIMKGGLSSSGARAATSHTGAMAGNEEIWDGFFKQTGAINVNSLEEMGETVISLLNIPPVTRVQAAVFGIGGGNTVLNGDICAKEGLEVPALSPQTVRGFSELISLVNQGIANPMDAPILIADPLNRHRAIELLNADPAIDIIIMSLNRGFYSSDLYGDGMSRLSDLVKEMKEFDKEFPDGKPVVVAISDQGYLAEAETCIHKLRQGGITAFPSLSRACRALRRVAGYHEFVKPKTCIQFFRREI